MNTSEIKIESHYSLEEAMGFLRADGHSWLADWLEEAAYEMFSEADEEDIHAAQDVAYMEGDKAGHLRALSTARTAIEEVLSALAEKLPDHAEAIREAGQAILARIKP